MIFRVLLFLVLFPIVDLIVLGLIARAISWEWVTVWILLTAGLGIWVIRRTGLRWRERLRLQSARGVHVAAGVLDQITIVIAGVLLILPGLAGDLLGLALLIPPVRRFVQLWVIVKLTTSGQEQPAATGNQTGAQIIDVKVVDRNPSQLES